MICKTKLDFRILWVFFPSILGLCWPHLKHISVTTLLQKNQTPSRLLPEEWEYQQCYKPLYRALAGLRLTQKEGATVGLPLELLQCGHLESSWPQERHPLCVVGKSPSGA